MTEVIEDLGKTQIGRQRARRGNQPRGFGDSVISQAVRDEKTAAVARRNRRKEQDTGPQAAVFLSRLITFWPSACWSRRLHIIDKS